ncbi:hypothetical protein [Winogradskyella endarachnes]|uniref:Ricin B lectin domain-containing protein n=1 Tax=Winogradskyella endarachnes TaxID=2681965 RepID=A0A6L6UCF1_9FLAO|nr:hypothetical protein [Winogradskyella endarachnes]MUU78444.1 hypothetical protein [Winogradskyella endarachnes]
MRLLTLWVLICFFVVSCSTSNNNTNTNSNFNTEDIRIGDTSVNYVNPEISPINNYMIWIEIDTLNGVTGKVWQCGINPETGDLIPTDGKGFNPFSSNIYARPADWGIDQYGVYYVGATHYGQLKFVRPTSPTTATVTNINTPINNKRRVFYPSQLPNEDKRYLSYILNDVTNGFSSTYPQNTTFQLRLLDIDNPTNDYLIEEQASVYPQIIAMDVIVPRWIKGSSYLSYGSKDDIGTAQAKQFNANTPTISASQITDDYSNKVDGNSFLNTANGNQYFISGIDATSTAYIYKRTAFNTMFVQHESVTPLSENLETPALNQSHEPFTFNNQLYSTFQINNDGGNFFETSFNQAGEIWLTTVDNTNQQQWLLSQFNDSLSVSEPEPFIGTTKVWVFYSAVIIDDTTPYLRKKYQLRRCTTPLEI